jgi:hypothetical protein
MEFLVIGAVLAAVLLVAKSGPGADKSAPVSAAGVGSTYSGSSGSFMAQPLAPGVSVQMLQPSSAPSGPAPGAIAPETPNMVSSGPVKPPTTPILRPPLLAPGKIATLPARPVGGGGVYSNVRITSPVRPTGAAGYGKYVA